METPTSNLPNASTPETNSQVEDSRNPRSNKAIGGLVIVAVGGFLLARQLGVDLPNWLFSWPMFLIAIGIYVGAKQNFKDLGWLIPVAIGVVFIADDYLLDYQLKKLFWPVLIIIVGLVMIFKTRKKSDGYWNDKFGGNAFESSEGIMESVTIFGGVKKNIISKDFRGGEAVTVFGGTELNLMQADTQHRIELELVQVFGGTKLIIPPHWKVQTEEMVTIFGGLNDKRPLPSPNHAEPEKILLLKGACIFGGIDIKSY